MCVVVCFLFCFFNGHNKPIRFQEPLFRFNTIWTGLEWMMKLDWVVQGVIWKHFAELDNCSNIKIKKVTISIDKLWNFESPSEKVIKQWDSVNTWHKITVEVLFLVLKTLFTIQILYCHHFVLLWLFIICCFIKFLLPAACHTG